MAGHSKWHNIKHKKNAKDAKRGKIFMKLAKEIYVAAKQGGDDLETNSALRLAIDKAKANNMPNDNIDRAINKATGNLDGENYEEIVYEGYGPGGIAVMVETLTDNKNRTASEVRHAFSKNNGNLGENGCVSFMFHRKGYIVIKRDDIEVDEDTFMLEAIEAGCEEVEANDEVYEIYTAVEDFEDVKNTLQESYQLEVAELSMFPDTYTSISDDQSDDMDNLIDMLDDLDDVQEVHHNMQ
ncbi:YebC/PmpR family DNA-binding transcriptional regulator [Tenuibacillus multivorans]|uniref:Probable transcriptional regulatory protein SAMN05216498_1731 n=1 Tax=Tenuibacillus multivorans TaxID=237069 RepID=A0A1G9ZJW8_9BACI|nr:YebC/PmpR family DNA-binding transcriptional regulator [Tenuibacillus multivorans]GEL77469.1 putative transcriptional regulatory protein YrbC [Tenuibacillus multivorans]SDN21594.1 DNA-binding regulatory protein, YebC/PmpR family [Tenuibacillus multivorans]